jgi:hypothetical protein
VLVLPLTMRFLPPFDVWFAFGHRSEQEGPRDMCAIPFLARFAVPGLRMPLATRFIRAKSSGLKRDRCSRPPHR